MELIFTPEGVCASAIRLRVEAGTIMEVVFEGGCDGNAKGIGRLVEGMPADEVVRRLRGLSCDGAATSCPDQLARALELMADRT